MKNRFGLYMPEKSDIKAIWEKAIFVYDANVLLDLYRFSELARNQLLDVLTGLSNKSWLPNQSLLEFTKNRLTVIRELEQQYENIITFLKKQFNSIIFSEHIKQVANRHPFIDSEHIVDPIKQAFSDIKRKIDKLKMDHPIIERDDRVFSKLHSIFFEKTGAPYSSNDLISIYNEADIRYKAKIPPGYKDDDKPMPDKYGDVVFWYQVIDYAKSKQKPIILVTGDKKEDWWLKNGPIRPELLEEFRKKTGMALWAYKPKHFINFAGDYLCLEVNQATTETKAIQESRDREYHYYQALTAAKLDREIAIKNIQEAQNKAKQEIEEQQDSYGWTFGPLINNPLVQVYQSIPMSPYEINVEPYSYSPTQFKNED